jgi:signal-transduction protein with cAMP-binding, CBS, and nucleotidyltransferase domain
MTEFSFIEQSRVHFREGEVVYKKGEMAEQMYVVMSGRVRLYLADSASGAWSEELSKGDFFGEGSLLELLPREATAVAIEDSELISLSRGAFVRMIKQSPEISVKMMQSLTRRNRELAARMGPEQNNLAVGGSAGATGPMPPKRQAYLVSVASRHKYAIESANALVGRFDPATGVCPDIDLTSDDVQLSVSRRHAHILFEHGRWFVREEKGVANGTYVHGERLAQGDVREIFDGDRVGFGMVMLDFHL